MSRFLRELSPGRVVRAAVADGAGRWPNSYPALVPVESVDVETGPVAMFLACRRRRWGGTHRYRCVVLDLDASRGGREAVQRQAAALTELLRGHGIAVVRVASGPSGGVHLWTACRAGLMPAVVRRLAEAIALLYPTVDPQPLLNPLQGAVRPPGALHRSGGRAYLTDRTPDEAITVLKAGSPGGAFEALLSTVEGMAAAPALWSQQRARAAAPSIRSGGRSIPPSVAALGPVVRPVATDSNGRPRLQVPYRPLGPRAQAAARRRPRDEPGAHQTAAHVTLKALALAGLTYDQAAELAADTSRSPALEWLRTTSGTGGRRAPLDAAAAARRLDRAWWVAVQAAARLPRRRHEDDEGAFLTAAATAAADLLSRIEASGTARWRRPSGPADRAVLRAIAWLMTTSGETEVTADVRRIAVLAGYSKSTAALALARTLRDGWIEETAEATPAAGVARRVRLAAAHQCSDDPHHMCAHYVADQEKSGSDRRRYAAAPVGTQGELLAQLGDLIAHQQAGVWHALGHHAARTLETIQNRPRTTLETLRDATGYTRTTLARHLIRLAILELVTFTPGPRGAQATRSTRTTLYDAGTDTRTASRPAELAAVAAVEVEAARWWRREVEWCRLSRQAKRAHGPRAHARQAVMPGTDPYARAYPRRPSKAGKPDRGDADHRAAFAIEAERIGAAELAVEADQLARHAHVVDPARLAHRTPAATPLTQAYAAAA